ncbi:MAG: 2-oxoacid:acceptor oxidoreductase family protein [Candidatus Ornithomonoglobus sp.]
MEYKVIISGFGGQGVLFAGKILAQAAMSCGLNVSWLPSYGPEMRGGTCNCRVVISDGDISSPAVKRADALIAMNRPSVEKFAADTDGMIITDNKFVKLCGGEAEIIGMDMSLCADGELKGLANMMLLGELIRRSGIVSEEAARGILSMAGKNAEKNIKALQNPAA